MSGEAVPGGYEAPTIAKWILEVRCGTFVGPAGLEPATERL